MLRRWRRWRPLAPSWPPLVASCGRLRSLAVACRLPCDRLRRFFWLLPSQEGVRFRLRRSLAAIAAVASRFIGFLLVGYHYGLSSDPICHKREMGRLRSLASLALSRLHEGGREIIEGVWACAKEQKDQKEKKQWAIFTPYIFRKTTTVHYTSNKKKYEG